jgi:hypothetical protein
MGAQPDAGSGEPEKQIYVLADLELPVGLEAEPTGAHVAAPLGHGHFPVQPGEDSRVVPG